MSALINVNILHTPQAKMIGRQYGLSINIKIYSYTASYTLHMYIFHHRHHQNFVNYVNLIGTLQKRRSSSLRHIRCEDDPNTCACALCTVHCAVHMQCVEHIAQMWVDGNFNWNSYNISVNSWCTPGNHSCCCGNCYKPKVLKLPFLSIYSSLMSTMYSPVSLYVTGLAQLFWN